MASTIRSLQADLKATGATKFKRQILAGAAAMGRFSDKAVGMVGALGGMRGALGLTAGALAAYAGGKGLAAATRSSIEFETATAELAKLLGDMPAKAAADEIRDLANELPVARDQLMGVTESAARMGIRGTRSLRNFTKIMAKVGVATDESATQGAKSLAKLAAITQTPMDKMRHLASVVNESSNEIEGSFSEILDASLRAAPGLAQLGAAQSEIVALAGTLQVVSASSERAGTRLNRLASAMANPKKVAAFAEALDMTTGQFNALVDSSPSDAVLRLARAMREGGASADLLASELGETSLKVLRGLGQNLEEARKQQKLLADEWKRGTSIGEEFARFAGITESRLTQLDNIATNLATTIGTPLREALNEAATGLTEVANQTSTFTMLADVLGSTVQTIVSGVRVAFNAVEIAVTAALTTVFELFGQVARRINDMLRLLNKGAEIIGADWRFALLDAQGALDLAEQGASAIGDDLGDMVDATTDVGRSWGTTLGLIEETDTAVQETQSGVEQTAQGTQRMAEGAERARDALVEMSVSDIMQTPMSDFPFDRMLKLNRQQTEVRAEVARIHESAAQKTREFLSKVKLSRIQNEMRRTSQAARSVAGQITSAFSSIITGSKGVVDAFSNMVDGILQELTRLLVQKQLTNLLFSLVGGGIPTAPDTSGIHAGVSSPNLGALSTAGGVPGFARGGSFRVGGSGGRDSQLVAFRATPGERVDVTPKGQQRQTVIRNEVNLNVQAMDARSFRKFANGPGKAGIVEAVAKATSESVAAQRAVLGQG